MIKVVYWNVLYSHPHGFDSFPMFAHECKDEKRGPTETEALNALGVEHKLGDDEWLEISDRQVAYIPVPKLPTKE